MKILDPRSGNEVFVDYPRDFPADANSAKGFMASVRILQEGLDRPKPPSMAARASWRLFGSRTSSGARALSPSHRHQNDLLRSKWRWQPCAFQVGVRLGMNTGLSLRRNAIGWPRSQRLLPSVSSFAVN